jgi:Mn-containing catalase
MIHRVDKWAVELPPPSTPDPPGAAIVQELMGGRFGEMSTLLNYTFQSFNFRNRQGRRPFYDLIANIAAESSATSRSSPPRSTRCSPGAPTRTSRRARRWATSRTSRATRTTTSPAASPPCRRTRRAGPGTGTTCSRPGDLIQDLTHNFFLESGARREKLRVYETVDHPAARALTGYLLVRGGVHQVAYARAVELITGADLTKLFPTPNIPTDKIPESQPYIQRGEHLKLYRFSPDDYKEIVAVFTGPHPETGEPLEVVDHPPEGFPPVDLPPQVAVSTPDYSPEEITEIALRLRQQAGLGDEPLGEVIPANSGMMNKARKAVDKVTPG